MIDYAADGQKVKPKNRKQSAILSNDNCMNVHNDRARVFLLFF